MGKTLGHTVEVAFAEEEAAGNPAVVAFAGIHAVLVVVLVGIPGEHLEAAGIGSCLVVDGIAVVVVVDTG